jgi:succinyl-diaminopimelate desuccinylase
MELMDLMDLERLVARATTLIAVRSTADRPDELRRALDLVIDQVGQGRTVERFESNGKPSALLYRGPTRPAFRVILNAHLDVVDGRDEQFVARREGDRLYGRGAQDMKVAALVLADVFAALVDEVAYPLALQLVTDEEVGGRDGTAHQLDQGVTGRFVIIGEQSGLRIVTESKGLVRAQLRAAGRAAHAAYPWLGDNAVLRLTRGLDALLARYPVPAEEAWTTTINVARVETTNRTVNMVPADATAWLDIRYPPEDAAFNGRTPEAIGVFLAELSGLDVTVAQVDPPHHADPGGAEVALLRAAAQRAGYDGELLRKHGAADGRYYYQRGIDAVIFGPGGDGQHGAGEYVDLTTVAAYHRSLVETLRAIDG